VIQTWLRRHEVEAVARGLYRVVAEAPTELETLALVSQKAPGAVVCLLTALHVHGIGTQAPREVWVAIDSKARRPNFDGLPARVVRFGAAFRQYGIEEKVVQGVKVRITSPARTVIDCFRYRNKIGLDVAIEALSDALRSRKVTIDEVLRAAEVGRMRRVIQPYLEALRS
jgi:predicted transcriptional regulator of viral defense system